MMLDIGECTNRRRFLITSTINAVLTRPVLQCNRLESFVTGLAIGNWNTSVRRLVTGTEVIVKREEASRRD